MSLPLLLNPDPARTKHCSNRRDPIDYLHSLRNRPRPPAPFKQGHLPDPQQFEQPPAAHAPHLLPRGHVPGNAVSGSGRKHARVSHSRLTSMIKRCTSIHALSGLIHAYGRIFNETNIMCTVSRLPSILRLEPCTPALSPDPAAPSPSTAASGLEAAAALLEQLLPLSIPCIHTFDPRQLVAILSSLARLHNLAPTGARAARDEPDGTAAPAGAVALGPAARAVVRQLFARGASIMPFLDADQGCHLLWAAARLQCLDQALLVNAAGCVASGGWRDGGGSGSVPWDDGGHASPALADSGGWPVPYQLLPMLLWSVAHGSSSHLEAPAVRQLLQLLLDPRGPPGSITHPHCLAALPLQGLVTALYSIALMHGTSKPGGAPSDLSAEIGTHGSDREAPAAATPVHAATLDALCGAILQRGPGGSSSSKRGDGSGGGGSSWMSPRSATNVLWALSHLNHRHAPLLSRVVSESERLLAAAAPRRTYNKQEVCNTLLALAQLHLWSAGLMRQLGRWVATHADELSARDVGEMLYALAVLQQQQGMCRRVWASAAAAERGAGRRGAPAPAGVLHARALRALAAAAERRLGEFSPRHAAGLVWDLTRLGCMLPGVAARAAECLRQQAAAAQGRPAADDPAARQTPALLPLAQLEPEDLSRLCWVLSAPGGVALSAAERGPVLDLVAAEAAEWCPSMSDEELVIILEAFAKLRHPCPGLLEAACGHVRTRLPLLAPHQLVRLLCSLAWLEALCRSTGSIAGLAARDLLQQAASGPLADCHGAVSLLSLVKLVRAYATSEVHLGKQLLGSLAAALCARVDRLTPERLCTVTWALSCLNAPAEHLQLLSRSLLGRLHAEAAELQQPATPLRPRRRQPPARHARSGVEAIQPAVLASLAVSLARQGCLPQALLGAVLRAAVRGSAGFGAAAAAQLLWAVSVSVAPGAARCDAALLRLVSELVAVVVAELRRGTAAAAAAAAADAGSSSTRYADSGSTNEQLPFDAGATLVTAPPSLDAAIARRPSEPSRGNRWEPGLGRGGGLPAGSLRLFLSACATLEFHPGEAALQEAARQLLPHVPQLPSQSLCQLLWSMASLRLGAGGGGGGGDAAAVAALQPRTPAAPGAGGAGSLLLCAVREVLTQRLCVEQLEVLSLGHTVRLAWALACRDDLWWSTRADVAIVKRRKLMRRRAAAAADAARGVRAKARRRRRPQPRRAPVIRLKRVTPRLLVYLAARAFASPPDSVGVGGCPLLQRQLLELKLLLQADCRPRSTWRALARRWQQRAGRGGGDGGGQPALPQPPEARQRERQCAAQVSSCLQRLGLADGSRWMPTAQADPVLVFKAWTDELEAISMQGPGTGPRGPAAPLSAPLRTSARVRNSPTNFALYMLSPRHLSCDGTSRELASSELRSRLLQRQGFKVLAVREAEWLGLSSSEQDEALRAGLMRSMQADTRNPPERE